MWQGREKRNRNKRDVRVLPEIKGDGKGIQQKKRLQRNKPTRPWQPVLNIQAESLWSGPCTVLKEGMACSSACAHIHSVLKLMNQKLKFTGMKKTAARRMGERGRNRRRERGRKCQVEKKGRLERTNYLFIF